MSGSGSHSCPVAQDEFYWGAPVTSTLYSNPTPTDENKLKGVYLCRIYSKHLFLEKKLIVTFTKLKKIYTIYRIFSLQ